MRPYLVNLTISWNRGLGDDGSRKTTLIVSAESKEEAKVKAKEHFESLGDHVASVHVYDSI